MIGLGAGSGMAAMPTGFSVRVCTVPAELKSSTSTARARAPRRTSRDAKAASRDVARLQAGNWDRIRVPEHSCLTRVAAAGGPGAAGGPAVTGDPGASTGPATAGRQGRRRCRPARPTGASARPLTRISRGVGSAASSSITSSPKSASASARGLRRAFSSVVATAGGTSSETETPVPSSWARSASE